MAVAFPTTPEVVQVLTDNLGFGEKVKIREVHHTGDDDKGLSYWLDQAIHEMGAPLSLQEFNDLAVKLCNMDEGQRDIFGAALQSPWCGDTLGDMVSLAGNLDCFELLPASANMYGEFRIDMARDDTADSFRRLKNSQNAEDQGLAEYIQRLEQCVDKEAYGKMIAQEENGVFTDFGYLQRVEKVPILEKVNTIMGIPCQNSTLRIGDLVLAAPHLGPRTTDVDSTAQHKEVFSGMVGTVTELVTKTAPGKGDTYEVIIDFTTPAYSDKRLMELDSQLGAYYGKPTKPGVWPPIDVDCARMPANGLLRITDIPPESLRLILDSEKMSTQYYNTVLDVLGIEEKTPAKVKPSLKAVLETNRQRSREMFDNPRLPTDTTKEKGEPSL